MASDLQEHPDGDPVAAAVLPVYGPDGTCLTDFGPDPVVAAGGAPRTGEQRQIEAIAACPPGPELDAWLRGLDPDVLPSAVLVEVIAAQTRIESYQHARTLGLIAELASREEMSPEWSPLAGAPPTQACVAGDELAMRLGWPRVTATKTVHRALVLDGMLGATREALEVGHLDAGKAQVLTAELADLSFQVAHAVEDAVLPEADQCSVAELRQRVAREIRLVDPEGAAGRSERARRRPDPGPATRRRAAGPGGRRRAGVGRAGVRGPPVPGAARAAGPATVVERGDLHRPGRGGAHPPGRADPGRDAHPARRRRHAPGARRDRHRFAGREGRARARARASRLHPLLGPSGRRGPDHDPRIHPARAGRPARPPRRARPHRRRAGTGPGDRRGLAARRHRPPHRPGAGRRTRTLPTTHRPRRTHPRPGQDLRRTRLQSPGLRVRAGPHPGVPPSAGR